MFSSYRIEFILSSNDCFKNNREKPQMKKSITRTEAQNKINEYFKKGFFVPDEMRKIKRLTMKYKISLKDYKKQFCKKCLRQLNGKIRVTKTHKSVTCGSCGYRNKYKIV